jgi:hypothetical protein
MVPLTSPVDHAIISARTFRRIDKVKVRFIRIYNETIKIKNAYLENLL